MIGIIVMSLVVGLGVLWSATSDTRSSWRQYRSETQQRELLIGELQANLGFDAFIHDFKNLVIRGADPARRAHYQRRVLARFDAGERTLESYRALDLTPAEAGAIQGIETTITNYRRGIDTIVLEHAKGTSIEQIDAVVAVDDTVASSGLAVLQTETTRRLEAGSTRLDASIGKLVGVVTGATLLLILGVIGIGIRTGGGIRRIQGDLHATETRYMNLRVAAPIGIMYIDIDGACRHVNPYWSEFTGLSEDEAAYEGWVKAIHPEERAEVLECWRRAREDRQSHTRELRIQRADGVTSWVSVTIAPEHDTEGQVIAYFGTFTDVTEVKSAEERLRRKNVELDHALDRARAASRVKSEFLATMSHEIRTPMNGILGLTHLLGTTRLDDKQRRYLRTIVESATALLSIVDDVLDISKVEAEAMVLEGAPVDLRALVEQLEQLLHASAVDKKISLVVDYPPEVPSRIVGDSVRLRQVLANLMGNAIKFTERGQVKVEVRDRGSTEEEAVLGIAISDTGIGIPAAKLGRIFDKFVQSDASMTRRFGGTGLGLSITQQLVGLMNGTLTAESEEGVGSVFTIHLTLPRDSTDDDVGAGPGDVVVAAPAPGSTPSQPPEGSVPKQRQPRILVADDDATNRMVLVDLLSELGYEVRTAQDGREAIELVQQEEFDVILMDGSMPVMGGLEATREIRQLGGAYRGLPIIAMTAHAMVGDEQIFVDAGFDEYITKPLSLDALCEMLDRYVALAQPSAST